MTCELFLRVKNRNTKKPVNPSRFLLFPAVPELFALYVIQAFGL